MQFFTYEEYLKFSSVIDNTEWTLFFKMLYFLGLRQGELQALNWNDIAFNKKQLKVTKTLTSKIKGESWTIFSSKTPKSNRILPLPDKIIKDLNTQLEKTKKYKNFKYD